MWALALALLAALLLGRRYEGTVRVGGWCVALCGFVRLGRVRAFAYVWRPGRVYVRVEVVQWTSR